MPTKLHFSRFEFKYLLSAAHQAEIEQELSHFLTLDPFVASRPDRQYSVRSLYFDDPAFTSYYEKIDGMMRRAKFRVRTYTTDPNVPTATFLEIKGRYNGLVFKHRSQVAPLADSGSPSGAVALVDAIVQGTDSSPVLEQFRFELERRRLKPVMLIDYQRRPFISRYSADLRLTFDTELRATHTDVLHPHSRCNTRRPLCGYTIMEVKFLHHVPAWFHRIIQSHELQAVSVSKYCKGVEICRLAPHLE